ncbi:uncharacterized protein LOC129786906 [Lutzomyia longipalpis]|uniref:uncharacterized protein LOC129786906 n=1 Tax=Lutzomyia longipalpis TaxID=7200 RepID=UPI0024845495|nr:uncharacterized protein LOC129786906 [Lutzomyia longipalpis]
MQEVTYYRFSNDFIIKDFVPKKTLKILSNLYSKCTHVGDLRTLNLFMNKIDFIDESAFEGCPNLENIDLSYNRIENNHLIYRIIC